MRIRIGSRVARRIRAAVLGACFLAAANVASHAQSCALCYTQAAASGRRMIHGLRSGIFVLIVPPVLMSMGFTVFAYKKRNRYHDKKQSDESRNDW